MLYSSQLKARQIIYTRRSVMTHALSGYRLSIVDLAVF